MISQNIERRMTRLIGLTNMLRSGFTLVELIMVILILSIAAAMVLPMASSAGSVQLRAAANMVAADLEYAKSMAISRGQAYSILFDKNNETYRVQDHNEVDILHPVKKGLPYLVDFPHEGRLSRVTIDNAVFNGTSRVAFDYLGTPYDDNGASLNAAGSVILKAGGDTMTVKVEPVTGFITVN